MHQSAADSQPPALLASACAECSSKVQQPQRTATTYTDCDKLLISVFEGQRRDTAEKHSKATLPPDTDLIRPTRFCELHQRPA